VKRLLNALPNASGNMYKDLRVVVDSLTPSLLSGGVVRRPSSVLGARALSDVENGGV
jgi:hypothetical protein